MFLLLFRLSASRQPAATFPATMSVADEWLQWKLAPYQPTAESDPLRAEQEADLLLWEVHYRKKQEEWLRKRDDQSREGGWSSASSADAAWKPSTTKWWSSTGASFSAVSQWTGWIDYDAPVAKKVDPGSWTDRKTGITWSAADVKAWQQGDYSMCDLRLKQWELPEWSSAVSQQVPAIRRIDAADGEDQGRGSKREADELATLMETCTLSSKEFRQ